MQQDNKFMVNEIIKIVDKLFVFLLGVCIKRQFQGNRFFLIVMETFSISDIVKSNFSNCDYTIDIF